MSDAEKSDVFNTLTCTSKRQHVCCECGSSIKPKERYQYTTGVWSGEWSSFKQCLGCHSIMLTAMSQPDRYEPPEFGGLADWVREYKAEYFGNSVGLEFVAGNLDVDLEDVNKLLGVK